LAFSSCSGSSCTITFNWPEMVKCASEPEPRPPTVPPKEGQPTDEFLKHNAELQEFTLRWQQHQMCKMAVDAWKDGWRARDAGKPNDPARDKP
jgi:hypothetical protein